jgi:hypothetical protein
MIRAAAADGVEVRIADGRVILRGPTDRLPLWRERLRPLKGELVAANDSHGLDEAQEERAAIMHFDGGIEPRLAERLALHGGFPGIRWHELALIDAQESSLWVVVLPDGRLSTLATVEPIPRPMSYAAAWPARFTSPEPPDETAPAAEVATHAIERIKTVAESITPSGAAHPMRRPQTGADGPKNGGA